MSLISRGNKDVKTTFMIWLDGKRQNHPEPQKHKQQHHSVYFGFRSMMSKLIFLKKAIGLTLSLSWLTGYSCLTERKCCSSSLQPKFMQLLGIVERLKEACESQKNRRIHRRLNSLSLQNYRNFHHLYMDYWNKTLSFNSPYFFLWQDITILYFFWVNTIRETACRHPFVDESTSLFPADTVSRAHLEIHATNLFHTLSYFSAALNDEQNESVLVFSGKKKPFSPKPFKRNNFSSP